MMQIEVSQQLAKPLATHLRHSAMEPADMVWRAELLWVGREACVVSQEQFTQYIFVVCGLGKAEFAQFPQLFADRLWREAAAICKQADLYNRDILIKHLGELCRKQQYRLNPEPMEEGKLMKVMEKLERRFLYERKPLPRDGKSAFEFSFGINSRKPKNMEGEDTPSAAEAFGDLCLNLLEARRSAEQEMLQVRLAEEDNIVRVDFSRRSTRD